MIKLYSKDGLTEKAELRKYTYNGSFMSECSLSATLSSPVEINFEIGDYCEYRGERFTLNYEAAKSKKARRLSTSDAFVYDNVKFNSQGDDLTMVEFMDVVPKDNEIHFTTKSQISFYADSANALAERIQTNLDYYFKGEKKFNLTVLPEAISEGKFITIEAGTSLWNVITLFNEQFGLNYTIRNRDITVGTAGVAVGKVLGYGEGNGLYDIEQTTNVDARIITRLRAYGSTKNMPRFYYNELKDENGNPYISKSNDIPNLMLPNFPYQERDPRNVFIDSDNKEKYGLRYGTVYFDGRDDEHTEIYPSIEGMTKQQLNDAGITVSLPPNDNGIINEVLGAENPDDDGLIPDEGKGEIAAQFKIILKDLGFDLTEKDEDGQYKYATQDTMQISMKSGMCVARTFDIVENGIVKDTSLGYTRYIVECNREEDNSIQGGTAFPNNVYRVEAGDKFVILGIAMPDVYVKAASQRLLVAAKEYLAQNDSTKYNYIPKVDEIFMANNPQIAEKIKEGDILSFTDDDLNIDVSQIIQTLTITYDAEKSIIPTYDVVVNDERIAGALEKMQNSINMLASNQTGISLDQVKSLVASIGTRYFLSKINDDTASGNMNFMQNVSIVKDLLVKENIISQKSIISDVFQNSTFTAGQFGSGFQIKRDANGQSYMEVDNLLVRRETVFNRLTIAEIKSVGGTILLSLANMVLSKVEVKASTWKCFFDTADGTIPNDFAVGDQAICRKFTGKDIKYYWALVTAVGTDYIELSRTDKDGSGVPAIGDEVVQLGNRNDVNRQYAIMLSAYGSAAPSINQYAGINSYDLTGKEVTAISPKGNKFTGSFTVSTNGTTAPVYKERGVFVNGTVYYLNDRVSYLGSYWVCIVNTTITTPSEGSSTWRKDTAGQTDINNAVNNIKYVGQNRFVRAGWEQGGWGIGNNELEPIPSNTRIRPTFEVEATPNETYYFKNDNPIYQAIIYELDENNKILRGDAWLTGNYKFKTLANTVKFSFLGRKRNNSSITPNEIWNFDCKLEKGDKPTDYSPAPEDIDYQIKQTEEKAQKEAEKVRTEYKADFVVLDTKIASKVSQTDFNALGNRVSTTDSNVTQLSNQITSVVETVDNIQIGGRNLYKGTKDFNSKFWQTVEPLPYELDNSMMMGQIRGGYTETPVSSTSLQGFDFSDTTKIWTVSAMFKATQPNQKVGITVLVSMGSNWDKRNIPQDHWVKEVWTFKGDGEHLKQFRFEGTNTSLLNPIYVAAIKVEEGNMPTPWTEAPEDLDYQVKQVEEKANQAQVKAEKAQTSANNAQNTADSKNRTYYQDAVPTAPSGGHKVGDLWYKTSLVDSSGNINADTTKNIYQLQYRWDGTTWRQINWSVSKSKIEQTDSSISLIVEKTGLNSVGAGSSLYSMIKQTEEQIVLEVSKVQVGGRNLLLNSSNYSSLWKRKNIGEVITNNYYNGSRIVELYSAWGGIGYIGKNITAKPYIFSFYAKIDRMDASHGGNLICYGTTNNPFVIAIKNLTTEWKQYSAIITPNFADASGIRIEPSTNINNNVVSICGFKLEEGNKATDWTPAPEDTQAQIDSKTTMDEVKAGLKIEADGVTIFGEKFTVNSLLIAKAIEAQSLNVGGNMTIAQNGTISIANGKIILNADGSGQLANGNVKWDVNGNILVVGKYQSKTTGNRFVIDPPEERLYGYDKNNKIAFQLHLSENVTTMAFFYNDYTTSVSALGISTPILNIDYDRTPTSDPRIKNRVWRNGKTLMISEG